MAGLTKSVTRLLLVRHGKAVDSHPAGDRHRELSAQGRERIQALLPKVAAQGFKADLSLSSPYLRAQQTAELFSAVLPTPHRADSPTLTPDGDAAELLEELNVWAEQGIRSAVLFTHNPFVSELAQWLLQPRWKDEVVFHTPSLWALEWDKTLAPHQARLLWVLHP